MFKKEEFVDVNGLLVPVNKEKYVLNQGRHLPLEDYGWTPEFYNEMVRIAEEEPDHEWMSDGDILNNLGIIYSEGVETDIDMEKAIHYFEMAMQYGNVLARCNLADIYRKGTGGVPVNYKIAFNYYMICGLPYAHYRVGEAYEFGRGVEKDLKMAKEFYKLAYKENHPLARKKLQVFDFLKGD